MLTNIIELMVLVVIAAIGQKNYKIPSPVTLMLLILGPLAFNIKLVTLNAESFDALVLITLPLLIATDALKLKWTDLKKHGLSLFWVAVIGVILSIGAGVWVNNYILVAYPLSLAAVIILFCMLSATDPITVSAVFSNFEVPHTLKVITEGESLFNDATALVVFTIAAVALTSPNDITPMYMLTRSLSIVASAVVVGLIIGYITIIALKLSDDAFIEATILMLAAYMAYLITEHFHGSGILAVIVAMVMANKSIQSIIANEETSMTVARKELNFNLFRYAVTTRANQTTILDSISFVALFASSALFVSIAAIADITTLLSYKYEILSVFVATTLIRAITMYGFALVSNRTKYMVPIPIRWWAVLTFAGSKGALSILMVHLLPSDFKYKLLFENIIIGNILLSTLIYSLVLAGVFFKNRIMFKNDCALDHTVL